MDHTFIIPAYGESPYIVECIKSLLSQKAKSNIIISTSTPSEYLTDIAKKFNIELIINNNTKGIASDWNFAYSHCKTKYLTLAHQDDIYLESYTSSILSYISKNKDNTLIFFTDYSELINDETRSYNLNLFIKKLLLFPFLFSISIKNKFIKHYVLSFGNSIPCPAVTFNKDFIKDFQFSEEYKYNLDWDAWLRLAEKRGYFVYIPKKLMQHRIHQDSQTSILINNNIRFEEEKLIFQRIWGKPLSKLISSIYKLSHKSNKQ